MCECCIRALLQAGQSRTLNMQCCRRPKHHFFLFSLNFLFDLVLIFFCLFPFFFLFCLLQLFVCVCVVLFFV